MSYTPNNNAIYDAAVNGFMGGAYSETGVFQSGNDAPVISQAELFGQAVDVLIPAGTIDSSQSQAMFSLCQAITSLRSPVTPQNYQEIAGFIVDIYQDLIPVLLPVGSSSANQTSLVFRPGGTPGPGVFVTEASIEAATQALDGAAYTLFFDFSLFGGGVGPDGLYFVERVGSWNLAANGTWTDGSQFGIIAFTMGTTIPNLPVAISGSLRIVSEQTQPIFTTSLPNPVPPNPSSQVVMNGASNFQSNSGPLISVTDGGFIILIMQDASYLYNFSGNPAIQADGTSFIYVYLQDGSGVYSSNAVFVAVGGTGIIFNYSPDTFIDSSMYPIVFANGLFIDYIGGANTSIPAARSHGGLIFDAPTGTLYWSNGTTWVEFDASTFTYTPAVLANWSGTAPTSIANALDRIAAKIGPIT